MQYFCLRGPVPSKKNLWRIRKSGIGITDPLVKGQIQSLTLQARMAWRDERPLNHFKVIFGLVVKRANTDLDNKLGCLMDVLGEARVIVNDNIAHCKRIEIYGRVGTEEETHVWLEEIEE